MLSSFCDFRDLQGKSPARGVLPQVSFDADNFHTALLYRILCNFVGTASFPSYHAKETLATSKLPNNPT